MPVQRKRLIELLIEHSKPLLRTAAQRAANRQAWKAMAEQLDAQNPLRFLKKQDRALASYLDQLCKKNKLSAGNYEGLATEFSKKYRYKRKHGERADHFCWRVITKAVWKEGRVKYLLVSEALAAKPGPKPGITSEQALQIEKYISDGMDERAACYVVAGLDDKKANALRQAFRRWKKSKGLANK